MADQIDTDDLQADTPLEGTVAVSVRNRIGTITLSRPDALNAFNAAQRASLYNSINDLQNDENVGAIIVTGAGRGFSAGADLREQGGSDKKPSERLLEEYAPFLTAIAECPKPVIGAINGIAAGIGGALTLACDIVVMARSSSIYLAFSAIGLVPDGGMTWHLQRQLGHRRAFEIMALGQRIEAATCLELGLANRVVDDEAVLPAAEGLARELLERAPLSLQYTKEALKAAAASTLQEAIGTEAALQDKAAASADHKEGRQAFLEKRKPVWKGC
ncbi:MAG: enoyl-CoA hydratase-related protein [Pseudomonadota bacterium]